MDRVPLSSTTMPSPDWQPLAPVSNLMPTTLFPVIAATASCTWMPIRSVAPRDPPHAEKSPEGPMLTSFPMTAAPCVNSTSIPIWLFSTALLRTELEIAASYRRIPTDDQYPSVHAFPRTPLRLAVPPPPNPHWIPF